MTDVTDSPQLTPREAYEIHVEALSAGDIDRVISGYTPGAVMVVNGEVYRGREAMRPLFEASRSNSITDMDLSTEVVAAGEVIYVRWSAEDAERSLVGVDTFVFAGGCITTHTAFLMTK